MTVYWIPMLSFYVALSIADSSCNASWGHLVDDSFSREWNHSQCYNFSGNYGASNLYDDILKYEDIAYLAKDSDPRYKFKFSIMECNDVPDDPTWDKEYTFYEIDLIGSWVMLCMASSFLLAYTIYLANQTAIVKKKAQYKETGIFVLDDDFSRNESVNTF